VVAEHVGELHVASPELQALPLVHEGTPRFVLFVPQVFEPAPQALPIRYRV
jgi:hypothetical protein